MFPPGVTAEGVLSSPNYPRKYPNNHKKTETIRGGPGTVLVLEFTAFDVESHASCRFDYLKIRDGDGTTLMGKTCGSSLPAKIVSNTNIVKLDFKTNAKGKRAGWSVSWREVTPGVYEQHFVLEYLLNNFCGLNLSHHHQYNLFLLTRCCS